MTEPMQAPWLPPPGEQAPRKKRNIALWVVVGLGFLILGGCTAAVVGVSAAAKNVTDTRAEEDAAVTAAVSITSCVTDETGWGKATVKFTSPLEEEKGFISFQLNFIDDANGTVVGSGTVTFENISAGQSAVGNARAYDLVKPEGNLSCEVADVTVL